MDGCVFCRILREGSVMKVFEDERTAAFMDLAGDADGHILVVPIKHVRSIFDCDRDTLRALTDTVKRVSDHLVRSCGYDGVNLLSASGESAGQSVPHLHIHLIPRRTGDGVDAWPRLPGAKREIVEVFDRIRMRPEETVRIRDPEHRGE